MNNFRNPALRTIALLLALPLFALLVGCEVDSTTSVPSDNEGTIYNFSGLYLNPNTSTNGVLPIVFPHEGSSKPSGKIIVSLRLLQYGSVLEAYDSANQTWNGSISALQGTTATFSLSGHTTAGQIVEVAGTLVYAAEKSTMNASWIEPTYYGTLSAIASVPPATTNSPSTSDVTVSPTAATLSSNSSTKAFSVSGGSGTYTWTVANSTYGSVNPTTGSSVTFTSSKVVGTTYLTVTDSAGKSDYATITYSSSTSASVSATSSGSESSGVVNSLARTVDAPKPRP